MQVIVQKLKNGRNRVTSVGSVAVVSHDTDMPVSRMRYRLYPAAWWDEDRPEPDVWVFTNKEATKVERIGMQDVVAAMAANDCDSVVEAFKGAVKDRDWQGMILTREVMKARGHSTITGRCPSCVTPENAPMLRVVR